MSQHITPETLSRVEIELLKSQGGKKTPQSYRFKASYGGFKIFFTVDQEGLTLGDMMTDPNSFDRVSGSLAKRVMIAKAKKVFGRIRSEQRQAQRFDEQFPAPPN